MSDNLSDALAARYEANSRSASKSPLNGKNTPSLPKLGSLPSLPRTSQPNWAKTVNKTAVSDRATEVMSFNDLDKKLQMSAVAAVQKLYPISVESSSSANGTTTLLIRGLKGPVEEAAKELLRRLSPRTTRVLDIPGEARPLILGSRGSTIRQIANDTDTKISMSDLKTSSSGGWSLSVASVEIRGTEQSTRDAVEKILAITEKAPLSKSARSEFPTKLTPFISQFADTLPVKFTIGESIELHGNSTEVISAARSIDEFISKCESTFTLRPAKISPTTVDVLSPDVIFADHGVVLTEGNLYGPASKLDAASTALEKLEKSTVVSSLDISRAHNKSVDHAKIVGYFLAKSGAIDRISEQSKVAIKADGNTFLISGRDAQSTSTAKKQLVEEVNKLPPSYVQVLPGFKTQFGLAAANSVVNNSDASSVQTFIGNDSTLLVFRQNEEDFAPSQEEVAAALEHAAGKLKSAQETEAGIFEAKLPISASDQRYIREPLGSAKATHKSLTASEDGTPLVHISFGKTVIVSGLKAHVDKFAAAVPEIVAVSKDYQQRSNYYETIKFDQKHIKNLVGRNGSNISRIREAFDVKIDVGENGQVTIKGLDSKVKKARAEIEKTEARFQDEVTEKISIPQKYHATLIGNKGKFVRRIKEKYDVYVQFPRLENDDGEDDVIVLNGPSKGVAQTKKEFNDLVEYEESHSQVQEITVPASTLKRIIGRGGANISAIKQDTDVKIDIAREPNEDNTVTVKVTGEKKGIATAVKRINAAVSEILDSVEKSIEVDPKYHRFIVGPSNETRRSIIAKAGGEVDPWNPRMLQVPPSSSTSNIVKISGPSKVVNSIEQQIKELVENMESKERFTDTFTMPSDQFTVLLGPGGSRKRGIEEAHNVSIDLRRGNPCSVTIKGPSEQAINDSKKEIVKIVKLGQASVKVPFQHAAELFNRGMLAKQLESEFNVRLTVGKSNFQSENKVPPAPELTGQYVIKVNPRIINNNGTQLEWSLTGRSNEECAKAAKFIEDNVDKLEQFNTIGYLWLSKPTYYSQVIGPMGATINKLRDESGCSIFVPKNARESLSPIEVRGTESQVNAALALIIATAGIRS